MVKISRNRMALNRLASCRAVLHVDTQKVRSKLLHKLENLYDLSYSMARNPKLSLVDRNKWTRVAAYTAQTINCVAAGFDEQQIDKQLNELESLVNEARTKAKAGNAQTRTPVDRESGDSSRSC